MRLGFSRSRWSRATRETGRAHGASTRARILRGRRARDQRRPLSHHPIVFAAMRPDASPGTSAGTTRTCTQSTCFPFGGAREDPKPLVARQRAPARPEASRLKPRRRPGTSFRGPAPRARKRSDAVLCSARQSGKVVERKVNHHRAGPGAKTSGTSRSNFAREALRGDEIEPKTISGGRWR